MSTSHWIALTIGLTACLVFGLQMGCDGFTLRHGIVLTLAALACLTVIVLPGHIRRRAAEEGLVKQDDAAELENETRRTVMQFLGGLAVVATLYFAWDDLRLSWEREQREADSSRRRELAEVEARLWRNELGAVFEMQEWARRSEADYHRIVVQLAAFVVLRSQATKGATDENRALHDDVRVALDFVTGAPPQANWKRPQLDLQGAYLRFAVLAGKDLRSIGFRKANLSNSDLTRVQAAEVDFSECDLSHASCNGASFARAILFLAVARGAYFHLAGTPADLQGADLRYADLRKAHFNPGPADKQGVTRTRMTGAHLNNALLAGASLASSDLTGADLSFADMEDVDLRKACLDRALFHGVTTLTSSQLRAACGSELRLPSGIAAPDPCGPREPDPATLPSRE